MANQKKPYRWRAYLDDFQMDATGKYVYTGKRYAFDGSARERALYLTKTVVFCLLVLLSTVVPECLPPTPISRTPLTLIPWGLQLISALVLSWAVARIFAHASELRAYVYSATVRTVPGKSVAVAILSTSTLVCEVICYFVKGLSPEPFTLVRLFCPALSAAAAIFLFFISRAGKWKEIV